MYVLLLVSVMVLLASFELNNTDAFTTAESSITTTSHYTGVLSTTSVTNRASSSEQNNGSSTTTSVPGGGQSISNWVNGTIWASSGDVNETSVSPVQFAPLQGWKRSVRDIVLIVVLTVVFGLALIAVVLFCVRKRLQKRTQRTFDPPVIQAYQHAQIRADNYDPPQIPNNIPLSTFNPAVHVETRDDVQPPEVNPEQAEQQGAGSESSGSSRTGSSIQTGQSNQSTLEMRGKLPTPVGTRRADASDGSNSFDSETTGRPFDPYEHHGEHSRSRYAGKQYDPQEHEESSQGAYMQSTSFASPGNGASAHALSTSADSYAMFTSESFEDDVKLIAFKNPSGSLYARLASLTPDAPSVQPREAGEDALLHFAMAASRGIDNPVEVSLSDEEDGVQRLPSAHSQLQQSHLQPPSTHLQQPPAYSQLPHTHLQPPSTHMPPPLAHSEPLPHPRLTPAHPQSGSKLAPAHPRPPQHRKPRTQPPTSPLFKAPQPPTEPLQPPAHLANLPPPFTSALPSPILPVRRSSLPPVSPSVQPPRTVSSQRDDFWSDVNLDEEQPNSKTSATQK